MGKNEGEQGNGESVWGGGVQEGLSDKATPEQGPRAVEGDP